MCQNSTRVKNDFNERKCTSPPPRRKLRGTPRSQETLYRHATTRSHPRPVIGNSFEGYSRPFRSRQADPLISRTVDRTTVNALVHGDVSRNGIPLRRILLSSPRPVILGKIRQARYQPSHYRPVVRFRASASTEKKKKKKNGIFSFVYSFDIFIMTRVTFERTSNARRVCSKCLSRNRLNNGRVTDSKQTPRLLHLIIIYDRR